MEELSLLQILANITDPHNWVDPEELVQIISQNPSLRGITYGYVAEVQFARSLEEGPLQIREHHKDDDHKKTKSDRTFVYNGRKYTVQLKSLQTGSIQEVEPGRFKATIQNDASDRRGPRGCEHPH